MRQKTLLTLFAVSVFTLLSCHQNSEYESHLLQRAQSIATLPVERGELTRHLIVDDAGSVTIPLIRRGGPASDSVVYVETWNLEDGYVLRATAEEEPRISAESWKRSQEWQKTASEREFFVFEHDPIEVFREFRVLSPTGRQIFPETRTRNKRAEQDAAGNPLPAE